jgi:hypothetical protein
VGQDRAVTGSHHRGQARAGTGVHDDAAVALEAQLLGELRARDDADADHHEVGGQLRAVGEQHPADPAARVAEAGHGGADEDGRPATLVRRAVELGHDRGDRAADEPVGRLHHGHRRPERPGDGRRLQADEAAADHDDPGGAGQERAHPGGVVESTQVADAGQVGAGDGQSPGRGADGERQAVEAQLLPRGGLGDAGAGPLHGHALDLLTADEIDAGVAVEGRRPEGQGLGSGGSGEELLGQRRALVRGVGLLADEGDRSGVAAVAEGHGQLEAGLAGADDEDAGAHHARAHTASPVLCGIASPRGMSNG